MRTSFEAAVVLYALGAGAGCALAAVRGHRPSVLTLALVLVEVTVAAQAVVDLTRLATGASSTSEPATHVGYVLVSIAALPAVTGSVRMDEGRWGNAALAIGCLVVAVVSVRMHQTLAARPGG